MPTTSDAWKRKAPTSEDTVLLEGIGNATFTGTGFMSNFQTGAVGADPAVSRLSPLTRNPEVDNRLATNTGGWSWVAAEAFEGNLHYGNLIENSNELGVDLRLNQSVKRVTATTFEITSTVASDDWDGQFLSYSYQFDAGADANDWAQFDTLFFTINSGMNGIHRSLWDNFRVTVVPEPSKAMLATVGLMLLGLRRQRRA